MKLKFKNQPFQQLAVDARAEQGALFNDCGVGNALLINGEWLFANMHEVQKRNDLQQTNYDPCRFCIGIEIGTGILSTTAKSYQTCGSLSRMKILR